MGPSFTAQTLNQMILEHFSLALVAFTLIFEALSIRNHFNTKYHALAPNGDGASYYFHYLDWQNKNTKKISRNLLGQDIPSVYPLLFFYYLSLFKNSTFFNRSWLPNYILKLIVSALVSILISLFYFDGRINEGIMCFAFTLLFSNIAVIFNYNLVFACLSPRYLYCLITSAVVFIAVQEIKFFGISLLVIAILPVLNFSHFCRQVIFIVVIPYLALTDILNGFLVLGASSFFILCKKDLRNICYAQMNSFKDQIKRRKKAWRIRDTKYKNMSSAQSSWIFKIRKIFGSQAFQGLQSYLNLFALTGLAFLSENDDTLSFSLFFLIVILVLSLRPLEFIGEPWRYIPYSISFLLPFILVETLAVRGLDILIAIFVMPSLAYSFYYLCLNRDLTNIYNVYRDLSDLLEPKRSEVKGAIWFSLPWRLGTYACNLGYGSKTTEFPILLSSKIPELANEYPLISKEGFEKLRGKCTHFIVEKAQINEINKLGYDFLDSELLIEDKKIAIFRI